MKRRQLFTQGIAILSLLGGCAVGEPPIFARAGRFALVADRPNGRREAVNGRFAFRRTTRGFTFDLMTPLNGVLARIESTPNGAVLTAHGRPEPLEAPNAEALLHEATGFSLPIETLETWLTMSDAQAVAYGWSVRVLKRRADGLPVTIRAVSDAPRVSVTLTLDED